jgi:hypothetical protein
MIDVSDENLPLFCLLLEMAFEAERSVALVKQALVHRPVRRMANGATLPQCLVLVHERTALLRVTLKAGFVFAHESKTARFERLLNVRGRAFHRDSLVHLMTISAAHFAFRHRMMMRQCERSANFQVTLETSLGRLSWINNRTRSAAGLDVQTSRPVAGFATHVRDLLRSFGALRAGLTYDDFFGL